MNYGLVEGIREATAYLSGQNKLPWIPYREDGNWEDFLPKYENQTTRLGQETSGCTAHGSLNQLETFLNGVYSLEPNYSERFTYNLVPIIPSKGTDPQNTHECIRNRGVIDESYLPMTDSIEDYTDTSDIAGSLLAQGLNWLRTHEYKHEWVYTEKPQNHLELLKEALKTSPIGVSVSAWNNQNGVYVSSGNVNNHYCLLYKIDAEGFPWVFDSYDHSKKKLSKDHNIRRAKRIWVNRKTISSLKNHKSLLEKILTLLLRPKPMHPIGNFPVTQKFLTPNPAYESKVHNGTDYACPVGTPLYAPSDGEIIHIFNENKTMGNAIYFMADDGKYMRFLHLSACSTRGSYKRGDVIGLTGNSGQSEGAHLHCDVWNVPINVNLIKTKAGVEKYLINPETYFPVV